MKTTLSKRNSSRDYESERVNTEVDLLISVANVVHLASPIRKDGGADTVSRAAASPFAARIPKVISHST
jgi:hypothetical protein